MESRRMPRLLRFVIPALLLTGLPTAFSCAPSPILTPPLNSVVLDEDASDWQLTTGLVLCGPERQP